IGKAYLQGRPRNGPPAAILRATRARWGLTGGTNCATARDRRRKRANVIHSITLVFLRRKHSLVFVHIYRQVTPHHAVSSSQGISRRRSRSITESSTRPVASITRM